MTKTSIRAGLAALVASVGLAACGGGGDAPAPANGTLRVSLTDAPGCRIGNDEIDNVYVTVERVRVHQSADAGESSGGWTDVVVSPPKRIDLLDLTNGRLEELGVAPIPAGHYTQVRMVLRPDQGNMASNSMMLAGQTQEIPLRTPSAMQSGLKIIRPFTVEPNTLVDLVLDFDACRSIVMMGNGGYALKPTLTASLKTVAGIVGYIDPAVTDAIVSAQRDGRVERSTVPHPTGQFVLAYLDPAQTYTFVVTSPTRGTTTVTSVPVSASAVTTLSTQAQPIPLPAAATPIATRAATGILSPGGARDTGVVRALQTVGVEVEVDTANVDATTGNYALQLPVAAPMSAPFSTPLPLSFTTLTSPPAADLGYRLEASAAGYVKQTQPIGTDTADPVWSPTLVVAP